MIGVLAPYSILWSSSWSCVLCLGCGFAMNGAVFDILLESIVGEDIELKIFEAISVMSIHLMTRVI